MVFFLFILGFIVLIYGADLLVSGASSMARRYNIPEIIIGLTVVSIGTSAPELFISLTASIEHAPELAIGNVLGSNIFNVFVIIGIAALIKPIPVLQSTTWKDIPFSLMAAVLLGVCSLDVIIEGQGNNELGRIDGIVFLTLFVLFIVYSFNAARAGQGVQVGIPQSDKRAPMKLWKSLLFTVAGVLMLFLGGKWIVGGADDVGRMLGLSEAVIGLTIVATATSLPELVTSIVAARKNNPDIAIGNVIGSNIFNIFLILGLSAIFTPLPFDNAQLMDGGMVILSHFVLFLFIWLGRRQYTISRIEGFLMVLVYIIYISWALLIRP